MTVRQIKKNAVCSIFTLWPRVKLDKEDSFCAMLQDSSRIVSTHELTNQSSDSPYGLASHFEYINGTIVGVRSTSKVELFYSNVELRVLCYTPHAEGFIHVTRPYFSMLQTYFMITQESTSRYSSISKCMGLLFPLISHLHKESSSERHESIELWRPLLEAFSTNPLFVIL